MMFVRTPGSFYAMRLLLGAFEAGFAPGVMLYLTYWFPNSRLAQMTAVFLCGSTIAGLVGSPLSGFILDSMSGVYGLKGWQWLFLCEGVPTILLGVLAFSILPDSPRVARWLSNDEKRVIAANLVSRHGSHRHGLGEALRDPNVYAISLAWFTVICGIYAVSFWMPMMIRSAGVTRATSIGLWSMIPYGLGAIGMIAISWHSDRQLERRWHAAICAIAGALALVLLSFAANNLLLSLFALSVATVAVFGAMPVLLAIPLAYLSERAAPGGIALINCLGLTGGLVSPILLGWIKNTTGSLSNGLYVIAGLLLLGAILFVGVIRTEPRDGQRAASL
jgi:MFS family permease